jgi:hypothetical protein
MSKVFGWCITGHHDECWITTADQSCDCECHEGQETKNG